MGTTASPLPRSTSGRTGRPSEYYAGEIRNPLPFPLLVIMAVVVRIIKTFRRHSPIWSRAGESIAARTVGQRITLRQPREEWSRGI